MRKQSSLTSSASEFQSWFLVVSLTSCLLSVLSAAPHLGLLRCQLVFPWADRYFPASACWVQLQWSQSVSALHPAQTGSLPPPSALQLGVCCSYRHSEWTVNPLDEGCCHWLLILDTVLSRPFIYTNKGGQRCPKKLQSIVWPAGDTKYGCKMAKNILCQ